MHSVTGQRGGTLLHHGSERIEQLCSVLGFDARERKSIGQLFSRMATGWGQLRLGGRPRWLSEITDDHTPFELSVAIDGDRPELRILAEVQDEIPTTAANWQAALAFNEELAAQHGVSLTRFHAIQDLFAPTFAPAKFAMWHAVCYRPGAPPDFKIYLNPAVRGRALARTLVERAMIRLGFGDAGAFLPVTTPDQATLYFSLDLADTEHARVKAYTGHYSATPERVEEALRCARGHVPGQVADFCRAMGGPADRYDDRPIQTCLAFTAGNTTPTSGTAYFPVRAYADSDLEVRERVRAYIHPEGASLYNQAITTFANRPLEEGVGMQSYISLRQAPGRRRITVYLSPEVYAVDRPDRSGIVSGVVDRAPAKKPVKAGVA